MDADAYRQSCIEKIALDTLRIETLDARRSDQLDFHTVSVWSLREALAQAYDAGQQTSR